MKNLYKDIVGILLVIKLINIIDLNEYEIKNDATKIFPNISF